MPSNLNQYCCCCSCKTDVSNTTYAADGGGSFFSGQDVSGLTLYPSLIGPTPPPPPTMPDIVPTGPCIWYSNVFLDYFYFQVFFLPSGGRGGPYIPGNENASGIGWCYQARLWSIEGVIFWYGYNDVSLNGDELQRPDRNLLWRYRLTGGRNASRVVMAINLTPSCPHWSARTRNSGTCSLGVVENPSHGYCRSVCHVKLGLPAPPVEARQTPVDDGQPKTRRSCCGHGAAIVDGAIGLINYAIGLDKAPPDATQRRRDICGECPESTHNGFVSQCRLCTCLILRQDGTTLGRMSFGEVGYDRGTRAGIVLAIRRRIWPRNNGARPICA